MTNPKFDLVYMSQMEGEWVRFPLCQMYQPPFFGFSEMLTTKKSASGVGSKLKWSHSGVIPAKSPKESTPGDSDSRNRCNPISAENCTCDMQVYNVTNMHTQMEIVQEFRVQVFIFSVVKAPSAIFLFLKEKTTRWCFRD